MAKYLMIQGSMSNVGKSLLVAALCRIFRDEGFSVAPFKSQNMALNAHKIENEKGSFEIGKAQELQAFAARTQASPDMNPVLLKPTGNKVSEVFVKGISRGLMTAREYHDSKKQLTNEVLESFERLSYEHDIVIIEGAGSPSELNLKQDDIANMGFAKKIKAPVLIVGDINPGGIFAQLYGTFMLLEEDEKELVKGFIINKFRGDESLIKDSLVRYKGIIQRPVLGIVPYLDLRLEEEDSLSVSGNTTAKESALIDIAVLKLPFTRDDSELAAMSQHPLCNLRTIKNKEELGNPDLIIVPKSSNEEARAQFLLKFESVLEAQLIKNTPLLDLEDEHQSSLNDTTSVEELIQALLELKGLSAHAHFDYEDFRESQVRALAHSVRTALDMDELYAIVGVKR